MKIVIDNFLASLSGPTRWKGLDLENNRVDDHEALRLYHILVRHGNALFDTYGMCQDVDGIELINCLLDHFIQKEDYRRCKWLKKRKEQLIQLMGYFDRCRREKVERVRKKRVGA